MNNYELKNDKECHKGALSPLTLSETSVTDVPKCQHWRLQPDLACQQLINSHFYDLLQSRTHYQN